MTDTDAERQRRSRAHRKGDHGLCDPAQCEALQDGTVGQVEAEVREFNSALAFEQHDPRCVMGVIAVRLGEAFDRKPSAALARALRTLLSFIGSDPSSRPGKLDEIRARMVARRVEGLLEDAG